MHHLSSLRNNFNACNVFVGSSKRENLFFVVEKVQDVCQEVVLSIDCTLSMPVTPKTISRQNQKANTTPQQYCTLSTYESNTKKYFLPEPKKGHNSTTGKKILQPTPIECISLSVKKKPRILEKELIHPLRTPIPPDHLTSVDHP
jgi:hypothetical protein